MGSSALRLRVIGQSPRGVHGWLIIIEEVKMRILDDVSVTDVTGFKAAGIAAGVKKSGKKDMMLLYSEVEAVSAAAFTTNRVKAAPILVNMENINNAVTRAIVVCSGNANACTGEQGLADAKAMTERVAEKLGLDSKEVLVQSTGVIGVNLPMDKIIPGIDNLVENLTDDGGVDAAVAIMTTDLIKKEFGVEVEIGGKPVKIIGMAKGSGMIHPNMATMLSFVVTDANIEKELLQKAFKEIVNDSYNMISVDGDTSTNDMACVIANGLAGNKKISEENEDYNKFKMALQEVNEALAKKIAEDGEGATKFLEVEVLGAKSKEDARLISKSVITSNLTKCAFFGADANWGRILCAMGYSGGFFEVDKVKIELQAKGMNLVVAEAGRGIGFDEEYAKQLLLHKFLKVVITLEDGNFTAKAWGCDLSYDYVKINGDYRS